MILNKDEGRLGVIDIYHKSPSILVSSFIKLYNSENGVKCLVDYYTDIRVARLLGRTSYPAQVSYIGTEYYREIITTMQKCTNLKGFPHITSKIIYEEIMPKCRPNIETLYGIYNWSYIWKNISSVFILLTERETIYKYIHEILPTKKRLKDIRQVATSTCDYCPQEESNIHFVYQCERYADVIHWFKSTLENLTGLRNPQFIKLSLLETPKVNKKSRNAIIMLMSTYIVTIWHARQNNMTSNVAINFMKGNFLKKKRHLMYIFGDKMQSLLPSEICEMKWADL